MPHAHTIEVDESLVRAISDERLDGRMSLKDDLRRGHHARNVIAGIQHARKSHGEHGVFGGDGEWRFEGTAPSAGFFALADQYGMEAMNDDEFMQWRMKRFPEMRVQNRLRKTSIAVGSKYGPARA